MNDPLLLRKINQEIQDFKTKQIQIVPGLGFNQYDNVIKIHFNKNSKFQSGEIDDEGDRKYYLNINKNPCKVATKAVDFDTKNIRLLTAGGGDPLKTWFLERDLKHWMRDKQFGKVLNRIFQELPVFGSVVIKMVDGTPYFVDLRNFVVEQSADTLDDMNYKIEIHNFTPAQFRKVAKQMRWEDSKVEETIRLFYEMKGASHIRVYERYGDVCDIDADGKETYSNKRVFIADVGVDEFDNYGNLEVAHTGVELSSDEWDESPYWEFHWEKTPGRWQGIGVVETLYEPQTKMNETANLEAKSEHFLSLHVFQTRDPAFNRNLKGDVKNGETFSVDSEVTEVAIQDRNGAFRNDTKRSWMGNRDEMTFAYDAIQGERSPAGTPLGSTQISIGQTLSYFEGIQENIAMDVKEMLYADTLPNFEKENNMEHTLRLVGKDLDQYIAMVKNELVLKEIIRIAQKTGKLVSNEERDVIGVAVEESIKQEKEKLLDIPKGFYKGLKYDIDIDITGESVDTRVRYATRFAILQAMQADPTMTTDPVKKKFLYGIAEDGGLNPADLFDVTDSKSPQEMMAPQMGPGGGGVSAPALDNKIPGVNQGTV